MGNLCAERENYFLTFVARFDVFSAKVLFKCMISMRLKVVSNEKEEGSEKCQTFTLTAALDVLFSLNFAVVFDFRYFRFHPSKAKSIGNVLRNRQNSANCCLHRE